MLKWLSEDLGNLDAVKQVLRLEGHLAAGERFVDHSTVFDEASRVLLEVFGARTGAHTRVALGSPSLPRGAAVELALWVEVFPRE